MKKDPNIPSLLPYLQAGDYKFRLEISLVSRESRGHEGSSYPFLQISDAGPFARLLVGKIVTSADSAVKHVFLLQQSDNYLLSGDEIWPVTNADIDRFWREAVSKYTSPAGESPSDSSPLLLAGQTSANGDIVPLQSLFYCIYRNIYFHPICPKCGHCLQLCQNDDLLDSSTLPLYSTSLKRYLYCSECVQTSDQPEFYAVNPETSDPSSVKDQVTLINQAGDLLVNRGTLNHFPCPDCGESTSCYGNDNLSITRIVPYSFYPFHLLIFDAPTLNSFDFLAFLSGATLDELNDHLIRKQALGRLSCIKKFQRQVAGHSAYLFDQGNDRNFLEVLFLKLSFLGELMQKILTDRHSTTWPDFSFSLDRVWVKLARQSELLPLLWNFDLSILDIGLHVAHTPHLSKYPPAYGLHFLATAWFYVLFVNKQHSFKRVRASLENLMAKLDPANDPFRELIKKNGPDPVFSPENIFWNPQGKQIKQNWLEIWTKALDMGGSLLVTSINQDTPWSANLFWQNFETLREEIKTELFGSSPSTFKKASDTNDHVISAILIRLLQRWRSNLKEMPSESSEETIAKPMVQDMPIESEMQETMILSAKEAAETKGPPTVPPDEDETLILPPNALTVGNRVDTGFQKDEIFQETVILSSAEGGKKAFTPEPTKFDTVDSDLPETVILSPSDGHQGQVKSNQTPHTAYRSFENLITPAVEKDQFNNQKGIKDNSKDTPEDDDYLAETVVLRSDVGKKDKG